MRTRKLIGYLNFYLFQFLWFRMFWDEEQGREDKYGILFPVAPLTGWIGSGWIPEFPYWPKRKKYLYFKK